MKPLDKDEIATLASMKAGDPLTEATINLFGRLLDEAGRSRALLRRIELKGGTRREEEACPECGAIAEIQVRGPSIVQHTPGCELAALLRPSPAARLARGV